MNHGVNGWLPAAVVWLAAGFAACNGSSPASELDAFIDSNANVDLNLDAGVAEQKPPADTGPEPDLNTQLPAWFVHASDLHFGGSQTIAGVFSALLTDVLPVLGPTGVIVSGDIVEDGGGSAWSTYEAAMTADAPPYPAYLEVVGNHDLLGDEAEYLAHTRSGKEMGALFGQAFLDSSVGRVRIIATNTSDAPDGFGRLAGGFGQPQLDALLALPPEGPLAHTVVVGHHSMTGLIKLAGDHEARMKQLLSQSNADLYLCGHVHLTALQWLGETLVVQAPSLGKSLPPAFMLFALDEAGPAVKEIPIEGGTVAWPVAIITSPANAALGGKNPHATALTPGEHEVRVLAFSPLGITAVRARFEGGDWRPLAGAEAPLWSGKITLPPASGGQLVVQALAQEGTASDSISVLVQSAN